MKQLEAQASSRHFFTVFENLDSLKDGTHWLIKNMFEYQINFIFSKDVLGCYLNSQVT